LAGEREVHLNEVTVGVRELKAHLSEYLRGVRSGQTIVITDHGQVVGRILPASDQPAEERLRRLQEAGLLAWNGQMLESIQPPAINHSQRSVSDLVVEMRE
jgi:prevent-host-death family protein